MKKKHLFRPRRVSPGLIIILLIALGIFFCVKNINLPSEEEQNGPQEIQLDRQELMEDIVKKIGDISPVKPILGGDWHVNRFWFIKDSDENFYVEYEDGHILRQVLLNTEKEEDKLNHEVIGYFEPSETTWVLEKGKDPFFGENLDLYEYDKESRVWAKQN